MKKSEIRETMFRLDMKRKLALRPYLLDMGLTVGQGQPRVLQALLQHGAMTQREIAAYCLIEAATLSRLLDRLAEAGLVTRGQNPGCRRSFLVSLTDAGKEKAIQIQALFDRLDDSIWQGISQTEMEQLRLTLNKIEHNLADTWQVD